MQVILMQRIEKLGALGELVNVKTGYARNYLFPQGKAMRATKENIAHFESQKVALQAQNDQRKADSAKIGEKLNGKKAVIIRQAAEGGQLFGSVSARDIADAINAQGFNVTRQQVKLNQAIKMLGLVTVDVELHPEVRSQITVNIARSEDEAKLQEQRGGALTAATNNAQEEAEAQNNAKIAKAKQVPGTEDQPDIGGEAAA